MVIFKHCVHIFIVILCLVQTSVHQTVDVCVQLTSCSCQNSEGTIDLTPLADTSGTKAKFMDLPDTSGTWFYSWNPCNDFSEGLTSGCSNVAGCQSDTTGMGYFNLGAQSSATFVNDVTSGLILQYSATTDVQRTLMVTLTCDQTQEGSLDVKGEDPTNPRHYMMTLSSKYACPKGGSGPGGSVGISGGSIVLIIFFVLVFVYVVAGLGFKVFVRKASGAEMVPNYGLWSSVPGLIKDGFIFTFTCGRRSTYSKI